MNPFKKQYGGEDISVILKDHERYYSNNVLINKILESLRPDDFIIVGGGPVGLQTVIEMSKILQKDDEGKQPQFKRKICIIEKRESNERRQILYVEPAFWKDIPTQIKQYINEKGGLCLPPGKNNMLRCMNERDTNFEALKVADPPLSGYVRIDILQDGYYTYLMERDNVYICLFNQAADDTLTVLKRTHVKNIILSDGGGPASVSNKVFTGTSNYISPKVSNAIVLGFDCKIKQHSIDNYAKLLNREAGEDNVLLNQRQLLTFVSKRIDDPTTFSGYIGLQICDKSYCDIKSVMNINTKTYNKCLNPAEKQLERLRDIFMKKETAQDVCYKQSANTHERNPENCYKLPEGESPLERSFPEFALIQHALNLFTDVKMTAVSVFELTLSTAKEFYRRIDDQYYYLIGDAAFKTHFFTGTGLNRGFASSSILLQLLLKPDFNRELLATSFNLAQISMRNKLWKEQIPKFMFDLCKLHSICELKPAELSNEDKVVDIAQCFFDNTKKLFAQPAARRNKDIILWNGNRTLDNYNQFVDKLIDNAANYEKLLKLILNKDVVDTCAVSSLACDITPAEKISELTQILRTLQLPDFSGYNLNFTKYVGGGLSGGKKHRSRISIKRKLKRNHSRHNKSY